MQRGLHDNVLQGRKETFNTSEEYNFIGACWGSLSLNLASIQPDYI